MKSDKTKNSMQQICTTATCTVNLLCRPYLRNQFFHRFPYKRIKVEIRIRQKQRWGCLEEQLTRNGLLVQVKITHQSELRIFYFNLI